MDYDIQMTTNENQPTILVIHASVGSGHRTAANAIAKALELIRDDPAESEALSVSTPEDLNVEVLDILSFGRIVFNGDNTASMFTGVTRPYYDLTWRYTLTGRLLWGGGTIWARIMYPKFVEYVRKIKPLAIICTHITAANVAVSARMITQEDFPIVCVPTDYEVEGLWPHLSTDLFCVANEHMAETLRPRKIPENRILITGIPAAPDFRDAYDRDEVLDSLELPKDKQIVLALAGATLPRPYVHFRQTINELIPYWHMFSDMHLVIVAGKDNDYKNQVEWLVKDRGLRNNITVLGYIDKMAALMSASDLVVCKPGGLTVTECLCSNTPMILTCRAYGQEKANVQMLTSTGAALHAVTARELVELLSNISERPQTIDALLVNASMIRHPNAALEIAQATLRLIGQKVPENDPLRRRHFIKFYFGGKPAHPR